MSAAEGKGRALPGARHLVERVKAAVAKKTSRPTRKKTTRSSGGASKGAAKKTGAKKTSATKKTSAKKTSAKKTSAKKTSAKKTSAKKTSAKKTSAKKTTKKTSAKKTSAKKTSAKKTSAKKTSAKKTSAKKTAKKTGAKKTSAKKTSAKKTGTKPSTTPRKRSPKTTASGATPASPKAPPKPPTRRARPAKLDAAALKAITDKLLAEKADYEQQLADLESDSFSAGLGEHSAETGVNEDFADAGTTTFDRQRDLSIRNNVLDLIDQVTRALDRIEQGAYGTCERCGTPIDAARIKAFPRVLLCVDCKRREERIR